MNNKCLIMIVLLLSFIILILLTPELKNNNEHFLPNMYGTDSNSIRYIYDTNGKKYIYDINDKRYIYDINGKRYIYDINSGKYIYDIRYQNRANLPLFRYLENRDRSVLNDPLVAPERRIRTDQYPSTLINKNLINYPTRGYNENYQQLGNVIRKSDEKILQLFGRPTFPKSTQWEYYVISGQYGYMNKIPLQIKNNKELVDGDEIIVPGMNEQNGNFIVNLLNYNTPRYNPYIY